MKQNLPEHFTFNFNQGCSSDCDHKIMSELKSYIESIFEHYSINTWKACEGDWKIFSQWCFENNCKQSLPASVDTLKSFIDEQLNFRSTKYLLRILGNIGKIHCFSDQECMLRNDESLKTLIRALQNNALPNQKNSYQYQTDSNKASSSIVPLRFEHILIIRESLQVSPLIDDSKLSKTSAKKARVSNDNSLRNARDRALIHTAFDTLLRLRELRSLRVEDLIFNEDKSGSVILNRLYADYEKMEVPYLAPDSVREIKQWLSLSGISRGPLFCGIRKEATLNLDTVTKIQKALTPSSINKIFKKVSFALYKNINDHKDANMINSKAREDFTCDSARVGAVQDMYEAGISELAIMRAGRWKTFTMINRYTQQFQKKNKVGPLWNRP